MNSHSVLNFPDHAKMADVLRQGLSWADRVDCAVSFTRSTGFQLLKDAIEEGIARGAKLRVLTSTYLSVTEPQALWSLLNMGPGLECRLHQGPQPFHTKFWLFQGERGLESWIGSSNFTRGGLSTNIEWNLRTQQEEVGPELRGSFERLWTGTGVSALTPTIIQDYEQIWREQKRKKGLTVEENDGILRPNEAQKEALERLSQLRGSGIRRAAIIAATGVGKTYLAAFDAVACRAKTLLYVSHRLEHLIQARNTFLRLFPNKPRLGILGGGYEESDAPFLFATIDSLRNRPEILARSFDYLILDEFHHAAAESYQILRPLRERSFLLGLTATPERTDGQDVLEWCDRNIAYEVRLHEAIERQWLIPFHYFGIADETIDFERAIPWRSKIPLDVLEHELSVRTRAELVLREARRYGFNGRRRATVGFCAGTRHAHYMARTFAELGEEAAVVTGTDDIQKRRRIYSRLANPDDPLEWLFVADVLNEGVDIPEINSLLLLRPTESPTIFLQQLGRGLRLHPDTQVLTVLDFVGHHRSAWMPLQALDSPSGGGRRVEVGGRTIRPPAACEVILQRRTLEILEKVRQRIKLLSPRRERCEDAWHQLRSELGRSPMPLDLWKRDDLPTLSEFKKVWPTWLDAQRAMKDLPHWAKNLPENHPIFLFLKKAEADWQLQRVGAYALAVGLATHPEDPAAGYANFFEHYPQLKVEQAPLTQKLWDSLRKDLGACMEGERLLPQIRELGPVILGKEVEERILYHALGDYEERHCGRLSKPGDLRRFALYRRPEIIRHFGEQYDPAKHNRGIRWFNNEAVIICKLDTSGAKQSHQYLNQFAGSQYFLWTSQNRMSPSNAEGQRVLDHQKNNEYLHLFVQSGPQVPACYLGKVTVESHEGSEPMSIRLRLEMPVPSGVLGREED